MGEFKGTPGPWRCDPFPDQFGDVTVQPEVEKLAIAAVVNGTFREMGGLGEQTMANARAIAAVPEMLEALEWIGEIASDNLAHDTTLSLHARVVLRRIANKAEAALAKALGEETK